ncbi:MAG: hypothetical protein MK095_07325 [Phycisphaerales bacterium]|nr:hypothetical protein [Phycisphaerales bacterium]
MDRIQIYLDIVPLPVAMAGAFFVCLIFLAIPSQHRIFAALAVMPIWLTMSRLPDFQITWLPPAAKITSIMGYSFVGLAAMLHPGPRRELPRYVWLYLAMAVIAIVFVLRVDDRTVALILRLQWLTLVFAGIMLARTIVSAQDLMRIVNALAFGCFFALALPLSALILFPGESFLKGGNRFEPYGVNSNQIGMLFALALPLLAYKGLQARTAILKPLLLGAAGITVGMALLTGSRQTLLAILMVSVPLIFKFSKRPVLTIIALAVGAFAVSYVMGMADATAIDRFSDFESERIYIWQAYIRDVFMQRPLFGLLGVSGEEAFKSSVVGMHPHSAYFNMMYMGGLLYTVPMLWLLWKSLVSMKQVWSNRSLLGVDPLIISILAMLLGAMYVQGLFNQVVYWPTYAWSFLHIILACFFISIAEDLKFEDPAWVLPDEEMSFDESEWDDDEFEDEYASDSDAEYAAS